MPPVGNLRRGEVAMFFVAIGRGFDERDVAFGFAVCI